MNLQSICFIVLCLSGLQLAHGIEIKVKMNYMIDLLMPFIRNIITRIGYDPMDIPPISHHVNPVYITLNDGDLQGAVRIQRDGDFYLVYFEKRTRIIASLNFNELLGKFNYSVETFSYYKDNGILEANITNVKVNIQMDYLIDKLIVCDPRIEISHVGNVKLTMKGESKINWLKNLLLNIVIPFYKEEMIRISEKTAQEIAEENIKYINAFFQSATYEAKKVIDFLDMQREKAMDKLSNVW